jgi:hypothetical protein
MQEVLTHEGFAFEDGDVNLFPLVAKNEDG